ncbi:hypothetical protein [Ichthyobacterium seriolicida]|uniref:Uncharacterized protein n=1 Tax=Ichthyobacterium seriolicida TaxID=242600 RepID=A0A1J1E8U0_9FLAO|nr:hypothetical protein [Ichthyobacterium seriolicida]BAV94339.1 hypothetical protein JBKA6_0326 [Ichthyobacterium seriolicida]
MFKNLFSLLTLGLVVFSCSKPNDTAKKALELQISSVKFEKSKNLTADNISEFYDKLFITKTPPRNMNKNATADGYPNEFTIAATDIVGDSIINVNLPFNSQFTNLTSNASVKATITFKSAVEGVTLGGTAITGKTAEIPFEILATELTKEKLEAGPFRKDFEFSKAGGTSAVKKYTVVVKFSNDKSDKCDIKQGEFGFIVAETGANAKASFNQHGTAPAAGTKVFAHYPTGNSGKDGLTAANAIEFELRKGKSDTAYPTGGELAVTNGAPASSYFKADALILPEGAFIEADSAPGSTANTTANVCPITGNSSSSNDGQQLKVGSTATTAQIYTFRVVAQDGVTKKHYKLKINADAPQ